MKTETVDIAEAQAHLRELLARVQAGTHVVLSDNQQPVAHLVPAASRVPGLHPGAIVPAADFDAPLGDDFWMSER